MPAAAHSQQQTCTTSPCSNQLHASWWAVGAEGAALQPPRTLSANCSWDRLQFSAHSRSLCSGTMSIRRLMRSVPAPSCKVIDARSSMSWAKRCSSSPCRSCCCLYLHGSHTVHGCRGRGLWCCLVLQGRCSCRAAGRCVPGGGAVCAVLLVNSAQEVSALSFLMCPCR